MDPTINDERSAQHQRTAGLSELLDYLIHVTTLLEQHNAKKLREVGDYERRCSSKKVASVHSERERDWYGSEESCPKPIDASYKPQPSNAMTAHELGEVICGDSGNPGLSHAIIGEICAHHNRESAINVEFQSKAVELWKAAVELLGRHVWI